MLKKTNDMAPSRRGFLRVICASFIAIPVMPLIARAQKAAQSVAAIAKSAGLSGSKSIVVMDALTGEVLDSYKGSKSLPPASVTKIATAVYALSVLGADTRLKTRLITTGPIENGLLKGDLILAGSGDPRLDSDALGSLVEQLKARGLKSVRGEFYVYAGSLRYQRQIDPDQLEYAGYNPAIGGINLNFNRVFFKWKRGTAGYALSLLAQARKYAPDVRGIKVAIKNRDLPVYTYRSINGKDNWSVARSALGKAGSRWLPVRQPADYAGEVFRTIAAQNGIRMPQHRVVNTLAAGRVVAEWKSATVRATVKSMIKYSTNMTAETLGMLATVKRKQPAGTLRASASAMSQWVAGVYGVKSARFVDHSGLSGDNRVTAHEMARLLVNAKWDGPLRPLMKEITLRNSKWKKAPVANAKVVVKTGTLNFVSALAGYVTCPNGRKLVFVIITADMKKRAAIAKQDRERPPGTRAWARKSRIMQHQLIRHWVRNYGA